MDTIGFQIADYSDIKIHSERILSIGPGKIEFIKKEGDDYYFKAYYKQGALKIAESSFVRIDKNNNTASIFINSKLGKLIPEMIISRVSAKLSSLLSDPKQNSIASEINTMLETYESLEEYLIVNLSLNSNVNDSKTGNSNISDDMRKFYLFLGWGVLLIIVLIRYRRRT